MYTNKILPKLLLGVAVLLVTTAATAAQSPSGSVAFETAEGSTTGDTLWTGCTVLFKGKLSTCTMRGLSAPVTVVVAADDPSAAEFRDRHRDWQVLAEQVDLYELADGGHYFVRTRPTEAAKAVLRAPELSSSSRATKGE